MVVEIANNWLVIKRGDLPTIKRGKQPTESGEEDTLHPSHGWSKKCHKQRANRR